MRLRALAGGRVDTLTAACGALACIVSCSDAKTPPKAAASVAQVGAPQAAGSTPAASNACFEGPGLESATTRCGKGAVSRIDDTLVIRRTGGELVKRVDNPQDGDSHAQYRYMGRIDGPNGTPTLHVVERLGWEEHSVELINAITGATVTVHARPLLSPDAAHFAVAVNDGMGTWDGITTCSGPSEITVWRITADVPASEFSVATFDCSTGHGWGLSDPVWRSADTISFLRHTIPADSARRAHREQDTTSALLVHEPAGWALDRRSKALLPP